MSKPFMSNAGIKKGAARKGASRNGNTRFLVINEGFFDQAKKPMMLLVMISFLAMVAYICVAGANKILTTPVQQVEIHGALQYQAKEDIRAVINEFIDKGFMASDLMSLRDALLDFPWVYEVNIRRTLMNGLAVSIIENQVQALWNDEYLMNQNNDLFRPENVKYVINNMDGLVRFYGQEHKQVLAVYKKLHQQLSIYPLRIRHLHVMPNRRVLVDLHNGVQLVLDERRLESQLQHFHTVMSSGLHAEIAMVKSIDLRYSNGVAVAWQKQHIALHSQIGTSK